MIFYMIQNWKHEYPEHEPHQVLDIKDEKHSHYSTCDENGFSSYVPGVINGEAWFLPANDDVMWAFLGEKREHSGKTWLIVKEKENHIVE